MGFKRGGYETKGHRWSNHPDQYHLVCTKCGCLKVRKTVNRESIVCYFDKYGNQLNGNPNCKSVYDLLNEE